MQLKLGSPPHESGIMDRFKQNDHFPDIRGPVRRGFGFWSCYPGGDVTVSPMRFSKYDPANLTKTKHCPLKQSLFQVIICPNSVYVNVLRVLTLLVSSEVALAISLCGPPDISYFMAP